MWRPPPIVTVSGLLWEDRVGKRRRARHPDAGAGAVKEIAERGRSPSTTRRGMRGLCWSPPTPAPGFGRVFEVHRERVSGRAGRTGCRRRRSGLGHRRKRAPAPRPPENTTLLFRKSPDGRFRFRPSPRAPGGTRARLWFRGGGRSRSSALRMLRLRDLPCCPCVSGKQLGVLLNRPGPFWASSAVMSTHGVQQDARPSVRQKEGPHQEPHRACTPALRFQPSEL